MMRGLYTNLENMLDDLSGSIRVRSLVMASFVSNKAAEARMKLVEERQARRRAEMEEKYKREEALMKATVEDIEMMERVRGEGVGGDDGSIASQEERRLMEELQDKQKRQLEVYQHLEHILQVIIIIIVQGYHIWIHAYSGYSTLIIHSIGVSSSGGGGDDRWTSDGDPSLWGYYY